MIKQRTVSFTEAKKESQARQASKQPEYGSKDTQAMQHAEFDGRAQFAKWSPFGKAHPGETTEKHVSEMHSITNRVAYKSQRT